MTPSDVESTLLYQLRLAGLPIPVSEYRAVPGRRYRFDFAWPDHRLLVEVQGGIWTVSGHSTGKGITRDVEKLAAATIAGWRVLQVTSDHVRNGVALRWIQQAISQYGGD